MVYGKYDPTFLPELTQQMLAALRRNGAETRTLFERATQTDHTYLVEVRTVARAGSAPNEYATVSILHGVVDDAGGTVTTQSELAHENVSSGLADVHVRLHSGTGLFGVECQGDANGATLEWRAVVKVLGVDDIVS